MFESEDNDADEEEEEEEVEDVEENFVELLPEEDDPSQFNIYALFGVKITGFTYFIEFSKDLESHVFFFLLRFVSRTLKMMMKKKIKKVKTLNSSHGQIYR